MADEYLKAALYWIRAFNEKTKEKVWMMKLIELLNEYEPWNMPITRIEWQTIDLVISKRFWFIEWLVENEKIDFSKVKEKIWLERELYDRMLYWYKETDFLIMLLSIQDEPLKFLLEILK